VTDSRAGLRRIGFVIGLLLLIAAMVMVWRQRDVVGAAVGAIDRAALGYVAVLVAGVVANVVLSAAFLGLLISRYGSVGRVEMLALTSAATLANFAPLRPGLLGRLAYHKTVNDIPISLSSRTVIQALVFTGVIAAYLAVVVAVSMAFDVWLWFGVLAPVPVLLVGAFTASEAIWWRAGFVRYVEVLVWAIRYHAAFAAIGSPIDPTVALAFACVSVIATLVPFLSNGLGLREWAIGLLAPLLTTYRLELGVTAELVNRGVEIITIAVLGLAGLAWLARHRALTPPDQPPDQPPDRRPDRPPSRAS
jgi:hypothetical protein